MDTGDHRGEPNAHTPSPTPTPPPQPAPRGMMLGAVVVLSGFVLSQGPTLYDEINGLMIERNNSRLSRPIGFIDITPNPSYAVPPNNWVHVEGEHLLLWSGWDSQAHKHSWFQAGKTDIDAKNLHIPIGCDVIRAIDQTRLETQGGKIWSRMLGEMLVLPVTVARKGTASHYAYPLMLLESVQVVNDTLAGYPLLVLFTPFVPPEKALGVYLPVVDGQRVRLASSGLHLEPGRRPLLYDRQRRDLWVREPQGLVCLTGDRKGAVLKHLAPPQTVPWEDWASAHPDGHLIVGATRRETPPGTPNLARAEAPPAP